MLTHHPIIIEGHENYQKRSFRNKCVIAQAQGTQILTVPLKKGKHEQQLITDVRIAYDEPWQKHHLSAIKTAYGSAPYFEYYYSQIEALYQSAGEYLFDFNINIIDHFSNLLHINKVSCSESYTADLHLSDKRGIVTLKNYHSIGGLPWYNQVFEDRNRYRPNLSIIDLLFCCGPETADLLKIPTDDHE